MRMNIHIRLSLAIIRLAAPAKNQGQRRHWGYPALYLSPQSAVSAYVLIPLGELCGGIFQTFLLMETADHLADSTGFVLFLRENFPCLPLPGIIQ